MRSTQGFPVIRATLVPSDRGDPSVRIHLRTAGQSVFYRLDLVETGKSYEAVLPRARADADELVYFLEVMDSTLHAITATPEYRVPVVQKPSECSGAAAPVSEGPPGTPVPDEPGAPPFPPGLEGPSQPESLFVQGASPEQKKSKRKGVIFALGAAAGAAAGLALLSGSNEPATSPPTPPPGPSPPPPSPSPPPPPGPTEPPVQACFELPASGEVGVPVRIDASCSSPRGSIGYEWRLGDGRSREGRVINPTYGAPGLYSVELTVSRLEPTGGAGDVDRLEKPLLITAASAPPSPGGSAPRADLALSKSGALTSNIVDGVLEFHIAYTLSVTNLGPDSAESVQLRDPLEADLTATSLMASIGSCQAVSGVVRCDLGSLSAGGGATVQLDVDVRPGVAENTVVTNTATISSVTGDPVASNNQDTETTVLRRPSPLTTAETSVKETTVSSSLLSTLISQRGDGSTSGMIRVGQASDVVNDTTTFQHHFRSPSASERIVVEAILRRASGESRWRFEFPPDSRFAAGSIEVDEGQVMGREASAITFRLRGQPGERIRFSYLLTH